MTGKVVLLASAEHDLHDLRRYVIKHFSAAAWQQNYAQIRQAIVNLRQFPQAGSIPDELDRLNFSQYRHVLAGQNRIICELRQDTVYIHIIVDGRRNMTSLLTRRLLRVVP